MGAGGLRVLDATQPDERALWLAAWNAVRTEPQAHPAYCEALRTPGSTTMCAAFGEPPDQILMPFQLRPIADQDGQDGPRDRQGRWCDAITPYGYGGAFMAGHPDVESFWSAWTRWCIDHDVVSFTVRAHLDHEVAAVPAGAEVSALDNVVVDVGREPQDVWDSLEGRVRTDVRRAERLGVRVTSDPEGEHFEDFYRIYIDTMLGAGADEYYLFDREVLRAMFDELGDRAVLFHAWHDGQIVASEMNLLGNGTAYYFLSGATPTAREVRANPFMKVEVMTWLHDAGYAAYILGGGMSRDDGLFRYKRAYAPHGIVPFVIYCQTLLPQAAAQILADRLANSPGTVPVAGYLPAYRAPLVVADPQEDE